MWPSVVPQDSANASRAASSGSALRYDLSFSTPALHQTVFRPSTPFGVRRVFQCGMAEDSEIRRTNFRKLWAEPFSPSEAAAKLWGRSSLWSDLHHGRKSFGEKIARKIEDK